MNQIRFFYPKKTASLLLFSLLVLTSCSESEEEAEVEIPVPAVPAKVISAAENALPGIEITEAEIERHEDDVVYELEGNLEGKKVEIEIHPDGTIKKVEEENSEGE
jgi:uncharacterized membrane protein YkoI